MDAAKALKKCLTTAVKTLREEEEALAKRFLEQFRHAIFDYVKRQNVSAFLLISTLALLERLERFPFLCSEPRAEYDPDL